MLFYVRESKANDMGRAETIAYLRELIGGLEEQVIALASDQLKARQMVEKIHALQATIESMPSDSAPQKYSRHKRAIDAVEAFLVEYGAPLDKEAITQELVRGGYRAGAADSATNVRKSIGHHAETPRGLAKKKLRKVGTLIGLHEWPDEMFKG